MRERGGSEVASLFWTFVMAHVVRGGNYLDPVLTLPIAPSLPLSPCSNL